MQPGSKEDACGRGRAPVQREAQVEAGSHHLLQPGVRVSQLESSAPLLLQCLRMSGVPCSPRGILWCRVPSADVSMPYRSMQLRPSDHVLQHSSARLCH